MHVYPIKTGRIRRGDSLVSIALKALQSMDVKLVDGDVLAISSKALSIIQGRIVALSTIRASQNAEKIAEKYGLEPEFAELVLREADIVYGGVNGALLTLKDGILTVNAGIDRKNAPMGYVALWPERPWSEAWRIHEELKRRTGRHVGVLIVDSHLAPLRLGTRGLALAVAGFTPVEDLRGRPDLYGKPLRITRLSVADDLASAAHLVMGETDELTPMALIRDAPIKLTSKNTPDETLIAPSQCLYLGVLKASQGGSLDESHQP